MGTNREGIDDTVPVRRGEPGPSQTSGEPGRSDRNGRREVLNPGHVAGVGRRIPVVYGARTVFGSDTSVGDGFGSAPADPRDRSAAGIDALRAVRESMPSLEKRDARARRLTLLAYAAVTVVSVLGLCVTGIIAFS